ncbi:MAG: hypothetical protein ACRC1R_11495 [Cetobacterium sp.]|uniref:hypothetical protein n=1 Tax=Cetobacterium sp. TaxID=2071632 RepID=UPI003F31DC04
MKIILCLLILGLLIFIGITFMPLLIILAQIAFGIFILCILISLIKLIFRSAKIIIYILIYSLLTCVGYTYYNIKGLLIILLGIILFEIYPFLKKKL